MMDGPITGTHVAAVVVAAIVLLSLGMASDAPDIAFHVACVIRPLDLLPLTVACATCVSTCAVERLMGYKSFTPFLLLLGWCRGLRGIDPWCGAPRAHGPCQAVEAAPCAFAAREHCGEICSDIGMSLVSLLLSVVVWTITSGLAAATCAFFLVVAHLLKLTDVYAPHGRTTCCPKASVRRSWAASASSSRSSCSRASA